RQFNSSTSKQNCTKLNICLVFPGLQWQNRRWKGSRMCGISGLANWGDRATLARMNAVQAHRGPNDSGIWEHRSPDGTYIALGSRRLSILDLSGDGHMPMSNE